MSVPTQRDIPDIGDICAALFSRGDNVTYHWAFIIPVSKYDGERFDVVDNPQLEWTYQRKLQSIFTSNSLVCVVKLGQLSTSGYTVADFDTALRRVPVGVPPKDVQDVFRCRYWFRDGLVDLRECGFIDFADVEKLRNELLTLAMSLERRRIRNAHFVSALST